jgi:hypothetical protein
MAGEEVYIARLGAWIARGLGETGDFAVDFDTEGLGFQMPDAIATDSDVKTAGTLLADAGTVLQDAADKLDAAIASGDQGQLIVGFSRLVEGIYLFIDAMEALVSQIDAKAAVLPAAERDAVQAFGALLARKLIDYLVITVLEQQQPRVAFLLKLLGLVDWYVEEATGMVNEPRYVRKDLRLERIKDLFSDPAQHFANVYGWGTAGFDPSEIMSAVLVFYREEAAIETGKVGDDAFLKTDPFRWSRDSSVAPPGLLLDVSAEVSQNFAERIELSTEWGSDFESTIAFEGGVLFRLKPPFDFTVEPKAGKASGAFSFKINRNAAARGFTIVDGNDLLRLKAEDVGIGAELTVGASTSGEVEVDPGVFGELKGLTLTLGSEGSDSFLASLLAEADIRGVFDLGLGWKLSEGLVIRAAGGLEIAIPMHQNLGIASFETLYIVLKILEDGSFVLETSTAITGHLGPLTASVERMGVEVKLAFSSGADAEFGPVDLGIKFKPPSGVGLAIDAGVVKGGGYLYFDFDKEEYAGVLELDLNGIVSVKAIGLITTRLPDGSTGFSLLVVITAEFGSPIQLGLGFTLSGVGGLLGLNRTMRLEVIATGIRDGGINSVMFPQNVVENAPRIISDLKKYFPVQADTFLIGPMVKIGWGTPNLVTVSLGLIIEIPGNIAILGVLKVVLPDEEAALIVIQVNFMGALEFDKKRLWFFAALFDSRVLFITLEGEMGLLVGWGADATFLVSVGGFHPAFTPPPLPFGAIARIAISILNTSFARIRVEGYFAVTSNSVQFGAAVEIYFGVSAFNIDGHLAFDALFRFSPFYFIITISASLSVKVFGIGLFSVRMRGSLEGPTPWHVEGTGSISLLFFDIDVDFSHTWGSEAETTLPPISVMPLLVEEYQKLENWLAVLPANNQLLVSLRNVEGSSEFVLHPVGSLKVSQRAVPLGITIDKVGNQKPSDANRFDVTVSTTGIDESGEVKESFAVGQYLEKSDSELLNAKSFEPMKGGVELSVAGEQYHAPVAVKRVVRYEKIIVDTQFKRFVQPFFTWFSSLFGLFLNGNAVAESALSQKRRNMLLPFAEKVAVGNTLYGVAFMSDNTAFNGASINFVSQAQAEDFLREQVAGDANLAKELHVIPQVEMQGTA